jgi:hypothetical protein
MRHKGKKAFEFITRFGNFSLQGTYYRCGCSNSKSVSVLVSAGRKFSRVADELVIRYAASNSFQKTSYYLRKDFNIQLSHESLRSRILTVSGQIRQYRNSGDDTYAWDGLSDEKLYGYADGVLINIRQEGWKECKLLRYEDESGNHLSHRALLGAIQDFGQLARREAVGIGAANADELIFLMDGAEGFHRHLEANLPSARQIVDYWHVCQHIGECATALYGLDNPDGHRWRSNYCHLLREEGPKKLLRSLQLSKRQRKSDCDKRAIIKLIGFLKSRTDRIDYPTLLREGYRVDSGPIESSCKNVVQSRMKGPGMRWGRQGASAMLEIRCAMYSDVWEYAIKNSA